MKKAGRSHASRVNVKALVLVLVVLVPAHAALLTDGFRLSLFEPDGPSQYFDAYADALRDGRLDVDPYHAGNEAFLFGDVAYGYFGMTPALLRMPLHALFASLWGDWARLMMLLAAVVTVLGAHSLATTVSDALDATASIARGVAHGLFLTAIGLGSTTLFLSSRPNVYHEASALGAALTLTGLAALARWLWRPTPLSATLAAVSCVLALHARFVVGAGLVIAIALAVALEVQRRVPSATPSARFDGTLKSARGPAPAAQALGLALAVLVAGGSYVAVNAAKFGTLVSLPLERHLQSTPERLARTGEQMMSGRNVAANLYNYLMPWNVRFAVEAPRVRPVPTRELLVTRGMDYDWREPVIGLSAASPALLGSSALGLWFLFAAARRGRAPGSLAPLLVGSAGGALMPLLYHGIAQRYAHDMLPFLAVSGALALPFLAQASVPAARAWLVFSTVTTAWSVFAWSQVAANYQVWGRDLKITPVRDDVIVPAYERELRLHPANATLHSELGLIHGQNGRAERARHHLERALALDPQHEPSLRSLAMLRQRDDPAAAIELLKRGARLAPRAVETRRMLAMLLLLHGEPREAIEQLRVVVELDPADRRTRGLLAAVRARHGIAARQDPVKP